MIKMINLLSTDYKRQLRAARANTLLLRYSILLLVIVAVLVLGMAVIFYLLHTGKQAAEETIRDNAAKVSQYTGTQVQAEQLRSEITGAKQLIDGSVSYTKVIDGLARVLPKGAILANLQATPGELRSPKTLTFKITGEQTALDLRRALQQSPLFLSAAFGKLSLNQDPDKATYPFQLDMVVSFKPTEVTS